MTNREASTRRKFAHEILGLIGISALVAAVAFAVLTNIAATVAEVYCFENDVPMTEFDWMEVERWIFGVGGFLAVSLFCVMFLSMLADRMAYIRKITKAIDAMRDGEEAITIALEGNNELTELAGSINYMSAARQQIRQKEQALASEKEQLIRTLSHDIRTPLTSILAYSEYLAGETELSEAERKAHLQMIRRKAEQIRDLTDILLDGGKRSLERFDDARLLMEQLAAEFEESLEEDFTVKVDLSGCNSFAGTFDVGELRRIFDNLSSNVKKYADPGKPVRLTVRSGEKLVILQSNTVGTSPAQEDSYKLGIHSIRRIAQLYGGSVAVEQDGKQFTITIKL